MIHLDDDYPLQTCRDPRTGDVLCAMESVVGKLRQRDTILMVLWCCGAVVLWCCGGCEYLAVLRGGMGKMAGADAGN